jgi:hypothetical protein
MFSWQCVPVDSFRRIQSKAMVPAALATKRKAQLKAVCLSMMA